MMMKMGCSQNILLDHENFASGKSFVSFCIDFEQS